MDIDDVRDRLRKLSRPTTSAGLSKQLGVSPSYVSDVLLGRREPGPKLLTALGLRRVVSYEPLETPPWDKPKVPARANGGHARSAKLTPQRRREIAKNAAMQRWKT